MRRAMFRRRLLGARSGTVFILQELYFRKRLPSRLYRARVRIKIHSRNSYQLYRNVNNTGYFSMLNLPTSDCGSKVNCKIPEKAFISFATRFLLSFLHFLLSWPLIEKENNHFYTVLQNLPGGREDLQSVPRGVRWFLHRAEHGSLQEMQTRARRSILRARVPGLEI